MNIQPQHIPFQIGDPIKTPKKFIGRKGHLQKLFNAMQSLQNISLRGERRTGKTSLLYYISHPTVLSQIKDLKNHIPVYVDFQKLARSDESAVWTAIGESIAQQTTQRFPERQREVKHFIQIIEEYLPSKSPGMGFGPAIDLLTQSDLTLHLLFDEFDQTVLNNQLDDSFFDVLRNLLTGTQHLSSILATRIGLSEIQDTSHKVSSPLFNIYSNITLSPFEREDVFQLIFEYFAHSGVSPIYAEKLCDESDFLYELTGFHPFFLQIICTYLYTKIESGKSEWLNDKDKREAIQKFEEDTKDHFAYYWRHSSKKEQEILKKLASNQLLNFKNTEVNAQIKKLKERCLVVGGNSSAKYMLFSSSFRKWINQYADGSKIDQQYVNEAKKILIIEDEVNWQELLQKFLRPPQFMATSVQTYDEAESLLKNENFDLVTIDVNLISGEMQDGLGIDLLKTIQEEHPNLPRIVITGATFGGVFSKFSPFNVDDVLIKGTFTRSHLVEAIMNAIYKRREDNMQFDVFLAHVAVNMPQIEAIYKELKRRSLTPWIGKEPIPIGRWFQEVIQKAISTVKATVILIGKKNFESWEILELRTFITRCIDSGIPVIPVLLPNVITLPDNLMFLKELNWVQFRNDFDDIEALNHIEWGITGEYPARYRET